MSVHDDIVKKIKAIPPLSQSAQGIISVMGEADHDVGKVAGIIACDSALTARVLAVVNSAAFALAEPITTVARAVMYLGDKIVLGVALDFCTQGLLQKPLEGYCSERGMLWEHNLRTAIAAKAVARLAKQEISPDVAFTGGILHDIGKTVISDFLKDTAAEVVHELDEGKLPDYLAGEEEKLGVNHCMVGEELARAWKIPSPFPEIIRYHHRPQEAPAQCRGEVYAVHVGDILAMMEGTGTGSDAMCYQLDSRIGEVFTLGADTLALVLSGVEDEFSRTKALLFGGKGQ